MTHQKQFRPGTPVTVARQDVNRAKLAAFGYSLHQYYGQTGVVTDVEAHGDGPRYVVRFDKLGTERETYREDELEPAATAEAR